MAGGAMVEGGMIEEDTIVVTPLEADTVGDIVVDPEATLHTESSNGRPDGYDYRRRKGKV